MFGQINQRLEEAQQGVYRLRKIDSMLKELQDEKLSLEQRLSQLKGTLKKESLDVEKLEKKSIAKVFYSALGSLEDRLEKERSEALAVKLKYDQAIDDLEDVKHGISKLSSERMKYIDYPSIYDNLYVQKKDLLMKSDPEKAQKILDLTEKVSASKNNLKEVREAITVGIDVMHNLDNASGSLESAEGWGAWDMFGGGLITDLAKHSHIDDAKRHVERIQTLLRRFKTELADVKISADISIHIDGFAKFADFFFDGLIADWFMQSKIQNSQESLSGVRRQVRSIIDKLKLLEEQESSRTEKLQIEISHLITETR